MRGSKSHHSGAISQKKNQCGGFLFPSSPSSHFLSPFPPPQTTALRMTTGDDVPNTDHARLPGERVSRVVGRVPESLCVGSGPRPSVFSSRSSLSHVAPLAPSCDEDGVAVSRATTPVFLADFDGGMEEWKHTDSPGVIPSRVFIMPPPRHSVRRRCVPPEPPSSWSSDAGRQSAKACEAIQSAPRVTLTVSSCGMPRRGKRGHRTGPSAAPPGPITDTEGRPKGRPRHLSPWGLTWGLRLACCKSDLVPSSLSPISSPCRDRVQPPPTATLTLSGQWAVLLDSLELSWISHWLPWRRYPLVHRSAEEGSSRRPDLSILWRFT